MPRATPTKGSTPALSSQSKLLKFPEISPKHSLTCRTLLDDQILLIDELLSPAECKAFVKMIDNLPMELTPPKKKGEAERVNYRYSAPSVEFAKTLHQILAPHIPLFTPPRSSKRNACLEPRPPHSCNSNIRLYKYTPSQHFGPHYDDAVRDALTGATSEWTVLIYLTGAEDGVEGGETLFYKSERGKPQEIITAPLTRGTALLHRHGHECLLHEGSAVKSGIKYILRTDLMFMK